MNIITNNRPRLLLDWNQLTSREQSNFDYLDSDDARIGASFFRYRGDVYDMGEFMRIEGAMRSNVQFSGFRDWAAYASDSYFSGVLIRFCRNDPDYIIVGRYYC